MTEYITVAMFKDRLGITSTDKDARIAEHVLAACRQINTICHRTFSGDTVATARYFAPLDCGQVWIDDAHEITAVAVDDGDDGTFSTVWSASDYETDPANGIGPDGLSGWPATTLRSFGAVSFPTYNLRRRSVKVTAKWGWAAVPSVVSEAAYLLANRLSYEVGVPGGVTPANVDFGLPGQSLQRPYTAERLLGLHVRSDRTIGVAG